MRTRAGFGISACDEVIPTVEPPDQLVHDKYAVRRMPTTLRMSSGQFGVGVIRCAGA